MYYINSFFFNIEKITINKCVAVFIAVLGASFCLSESVSNNFNQTLKGDFLMMIGVIAASCFTVFSGKYLNKYGNIPVMIYVIGIGTIINFLIILLFGSTFENIYQIGEVSIYAFLMLVIRVGVLIFYCCRPDMSQATTVAFTLVRLQYQFQTQSTNYPKLYFLFVFLLIP